MNSIEELVRQRGGGPMAPQTGGVGNLVREAHAGPSNPSLSSGSGNMNSPRGPGPRQRGPKEHLTQGRPMRVADASGGIPDGLSEEEFNAPDVQSDLGEGQGLADEATRDRGAHQFIMEAARELGVGGPNASMEDVLDAVARASPTDGVLEAVERVSKHRGIQTPWQKNPNWLQSGAQQEEVDLGDDMAPLARFGRAEAQPSFEDAMKGLSETFNSFRPQQKPAPQQAPSSIGDLVRHAPQRDPSTFRREADAYKDENLAGEWGIPASQIDTSKRERISGAADRAGFSEWGNQELPPPKSVLMADPNQPSIQSLVRDRFKPPMKLGGPVGAASARAVEAVTPGGNDMERYLRQDRAQNDKIEIPPPSDAEDYGPAAEMGSERVPEQMMTQMELSRRGKLPENISLKHHSTSQPRNKRGRWTPN